MSDTVDNTVAKKRKGAPQNLTPFTPETGKAAAERASYCRTLRAQMRRKLLETAVDAGVDKVYARALKTGDTDLMNVAQIAMKLVGLDFAASEDAVQRTEAKIDSKTEGKLEVVVKGLCGDEDQQN